MTIVTIIDNSNKDNPETCDIWDTDNNSDNWEPETMTIFVIWQLIVTLDSIRNSCDVSVQNFCPVRMNHTVQMVLVDPCYKNTIYEQNCSKSAAALGSLIYHYT